MAKYLKKLFSQEDTQSQQTHEKMLNTISHKKMQIKSTVSPGADVDQWNKIQSTEINLI
jgi:hypothetical protein